MKPDIHPKARWVIFQDSVNGAQFKVLSTIKGDQMVTVDGTEYPLIKTDVSSSSHPFYTGQTRILDTAGRVEKFGNRFGKLGGLAKFGKKK